MLVFADRESCSRDKIKKLKEIDYNCGLAAGLKILKMIVGGCFLQFYWGNLGY